jgi:DNA-binding MarR family transcriptional regulator
VVRSSLPSPARRPAKAASAVAVAKARRARPPAAKPDPAIRVLRQFRIVFNAVKAHFRAVEKVAGLAGAQVWALSVVRDQPDIGVAALARAMDIRQSTASNLLKPMLEQGLVTASRADSDRRALLLRVTVKGRRVLKRVPGPFSGLLPDALRQLDVAKLGRLERDLDALIELLHPEPGGARIPLGQPDT